ncbi:2-5-diamino-6-ribosylamino-4(3H)-pyrimidinone 5'-phosphate reductase [Penicillium daleae]|uniref:2-5-diamino-6-ribosylamino-4(3H)-pyrimidinone 5'-phosphate reductase n=1 Tax=Penicillium daleae TaxID=63821 RepID=A0AAD6BW99_9EURO|nr:2-5-diamino-6-ribosylamino-4(3H)-pyrimidinone 5'-phosphate reductase [Penicillium daleae]KAJ5433211.1 2-5-diamino-6-ribosylamino-4(3H)-pyrimidinone 5'-phosphate reductase [Penicillium daleae]
MYDTTKYDVSYATASAIAGSYTKAHAPDAPLLVTGASSNVGELSGPGGADFNGDGSNIVFHAFENGKDIWNGRAMYVADIGAGNNILSVL